MTKKQRRKLYLEAAEHFSINSRINIYNALNENLPELSLFKPEEEHWYWFDLSTEEHQQRVTALLFCAEMCK